MANLYKHSSVFYVEGVMVCVFNNLFDLKKQSTGPIDYLKYSNLLNLNMQVNEAYFLKPYIIHMYFY